MEMLTTGEVARRLGVSRQHVVDLCEDGRLEFVRVGTHRRVPSGEVARLLGGPDRLPPDKARSLWLHRAVVGELVADPQRVLDIARTNLTRSLATPSRSEVYDREWLQNLDLGIDATIRACLDESEHGCDLRSSTPFAGVLDEKTRLKVLNSFREFVAG